MGRKGGVKKGRIMECGVDQDTEVRLSAGECGSL